MILLSYQDLFRKLLMGFGGLIIVILFFLASPNYPGNGLVYGLFTLTSTILIYSGFRKKALFFDAFIGSFLWLGFWLKLTVRVAFMEGEFHLATGHFGGSGDEYDQVLLAASVGFSGFILFSFLRERFLFNYPESSSGTYQCGFFEWYKRNRTLILSAFLVIIILVAFSNAYLGIYQRGSIPRTVLPFGLNGVYTWLLLFGLASFTAVILKFEFALQKKTSFLVVFLGLFESFLSNVSLLSRGMVLNTGALIYGVYRSLNFYRIQVNLRFIVITLLTFLVLFFSSVVIVNYIRAHTYFDGPSETRNVVRATERSTKVLFLDRWVGIEALMAVSSYPDQGWGLWDDAWQETYSDNKTSFYDETLIRSPYTNTDKSKHHFISLPGVVAFFFYPGSLLLLFLSMFLLAAGAFLVEIFVYYLGGRNLILCALLSQVVAFRFAHFGYVPAQSYLLFGTLLVNVLLFYIWDKILSLFYRSRT